MILCYPQMETVFDFSQGKVPSLVIEHPGFYRSFMLNLYAQKAGEEGVFVLSEQGKTLEISHWVEVIDNCLDFQINTKTLVGKMSTALEQTAVDEQFFLKTAELLQSVERYMDELAFSFVCDIVCQKCTISSLIKAMSVHIRDEYDDPLERLIDYMELTREFDKDKLFVFNHLRSYFSDEQMEAFFNTVLAHGYRVLLVDDIDRKRLPQEMRVTIDKDLCEF